MVQGHSGSAVGVVVTAVGGTSLVDDDAVEIVNLILDRTGRHLAIHSLIHVRLRIESKRVPNLVLNFPPEHIEAFDRENQNARCLVDRCSFCRVLL